MHQTHHCELVLLTSAAFLSATSSFSWASFKASEYLSSSSSVAFSFFCICRSSSSCWQRGTRNTGLDFNGHFWTFLSSRLRSLFDYHPPKPQIKHHWVSGKSQKVIFPISIHHSHWDAKLHILSSYKPPDWWVHVICTCVTYLLASVFSCFSVRFRLFRLIQRIFLVQLQHKHFLLDGLHFCWWVIAFSCKRSKD